MAATWSLYNKAAMDSDIIMMSRQKRPINWIIKIFKILKNQESQFYFLKLDKIDSTLLW